MAPGGLPKWFFWTLLIAVFALRMATSLRFGVSLPYWDEWDDPLLTTFRPWLDGRLTLAHLFAPHNEHRVVFTRLLELGMLELSGRQWTHLPAMVLSQVLYAFCGLVVIAVLSRRFKGAGAAAFSVLCGIILSLPFGWESMIWGFESQVYICMAFGVAGMVLVSCYRPGVWPFACGLFLLLLSTLAFAAGLLACIATGIVLTARHALFDRSRVGAMAGLGLVIAAIVIRPAGGSDAGAVPPPVQSLAQEAWTLLHNVSWPSEWLPLVGLAATAIYLCRCLWLRQRHGAAIRNEDWFLAILSVWIIGFVVIVTHARGEIASRYMDILILMTIVNIKAFAELAGVLIRLSRVKGWGLGAVWGIVQMIGIVGATQWSWRMVNIMHDRLVAYHAVVRTYVTDGANRTAILDGTEPIPYPEPQRFLAAADYAKEAGLLTPAGLGDGTFFPAQQAVSLLLLALGLALFALLAFWARQNAGQTRSSV